MSDKEVRVVSTRTEAVVLGAVTVRVYDTERAGEDAISVASGLFQKTEHGLEVFLMLHGARFILVSAERLRELDATPERVAEVTEAVSLILREDGTFSPMLYRGGVSLGDCESLDVFAGVPGVVS